MDDKKKNTNTSMGVYIALGAGIGTALGTAIDNIAAGVSLGVAIGAALGAASVGKQKKDDQNDNTTD